MSKAKLVHDESVRIIMDRFKRSGRNPFLFLFSLIRSGGLGKNYDNAVKSVEGRIKYHMVITGKSEEEVIEMLSKRNEESK